MDQHLCSNIARKSILFGWPQRFGLFCQFLNETIGPTLSEINSLRDGDPYSVSLTWFLFLMNFQCVSEKNLIKHWWWSSYQRSFNWWWPEVPPRAELSFQFSEYFPILFGLSVNFFELVVEYFWNIFQIFLLAENLAPLIQPEATIRADLLFQFSEYFFHVFWIICWNFLD